MGGAEDDLGAGYSSLKRLSALPFNAIKLDRELLTDIRRRPVETLSMIATLIQMGRDFGMNVAIEGLEDLGVTEVAAVLGAPLGQGYHLGRPMPAPEAAGWARQFTLAIRPDAPTTYLGGLAYHWQFACLGSPHPRPLDACPLTGLLNNSPATEDVTRWHAQRHDPGANHPGAGRLLVDWLVQHIRAKVDAGCTAAFTPVLPVRRQRLAFRGSGQSPPSRYSVCLVKSVGWSVVPVRRCRRPHLNRRSET